MYELNKLLLFKMSSLIIYIFLREALKNKISQPFLTSFPLGATSQSVNISSSNLFFKSPRRSRISPLVRSSRLSAYSETMTR